MSKSDTTYGLTKLMNEFENFINEPNAFEDAMRVRDYRHELFPKWKELRKAIEKDIDEMENAMMAMSDSLGVMANE